MNIRRLSDGEVFQTYRKSYKTKKEFDKFLPFEISRWLEVYETPTNCPKTLTIQSLLSLISSLCGPLSSVSSNGQSFSSPLIPLKYNQFDRIINPVMEDIERKKSGSKITLETCKTAYTNSKMGDMAFSQEMKEKDLY